MEVIINKTTNLPIELDEFKGYVVETSSHRDAEMTVMLQSAILAVEKHCNKSLANHEITLVQDRKKPYQKLYYRPVLSILSVTDEDGLSLSYKADSRKRKITLDKVSEMDINYTTEAKVGFKHKQAILDYATLLYNGSTDSSEYMSVLNNCEYKI